MDMQFFYHRHYPADGRRPDGRCAMLKRALILPALLIAGPAFAQSALTIYGLVDVGVVHESGAATGSVNKVSSGMSNGSRLGFKGVEDLGGGYAALFLLESGYQIDDGTLGQGGLLFGRQAYVGLRSPLGTVTLGRQYTPHFDTIVLADPFQSGTVGDAKNLLPSTGDANTRAANSVKWASPAWHGVTGEFMAALGEVAGSNTAKRQFGGAVTYLAGPLNVRLGYHYRNNDTAASQTSSGRSTLLAATYNFGPVRGHLGLGVDKGVNSSTPRNPGNPYGYAVAPVASLDSTDLLLGLSAVRGRHTWLASYVRKDDKTALNQDAVQVAVGHRYALSRRTDTYVVLSHISNHNGAGYTVGHASDTGTGNQVASVGIRHLF